MDYENGFILQKDVNWSLLNEGLAIPVSVCDIFHKWDSSILQHGAKKTIQILIDGTFYEASLVNQDFDLQKFSGHRDIIQIRYTPNSPIAVKLRTIFQKSYNYLFSKRQLPENRHRQIVIPDDMHENIRLFLTSDPSVLAMECCTDFDYQILAKTLKVVPEEVYEVSDDKRFFLEDSTASIVEKESLVKFRKIDRSIIRTLKEFYDYRDEISGEKIGVEYGESCVEAHHIDYFTQSQNNDSTNIIIISPNYHRIIHKNNPHFNRKKFQFEFLNGEILPLKLYDHLIV